MEERLDGLKESLSKSRAVGATTSDLSQVEARLQNAIELLKTHSESLYQTKDQAFQQKKETDDSVSMVEKGILRQKDHLQSMQFKIDEAYDSQKKLVTKKELHGVSQAVERLGSKDDF